MVNVPRAIAVAFCLGSIALPAGTGAAGTSDGPEATITQLQAATPADASPATDLQTDYSWDKPSVVRTVAATPPVERSGWLQKFAQLAPALLILALTALGLTITFTSLRRDIKRRRPVPYRPRGPRSPGGSGHGHQPAESDDPSATARS